MYKSKANKMAAWALVAAQMFALGAALPARAQLGSRSAELDPVNGFPLWYQDANGLTLALGNNPNDTLQMADPPVAGNQFSQDIGFGAEAFYWAGESLIDLASGGQAQVIMALEAAFANEDPTSGDQMVFSRIRVRVDAPVAGSYTVTHPYGSKTFQVSTPGQAAINDSVDVGTVPIGLVPNAYDLALGGSVGPFLTAVSPAAPTGYIGSPLVEQTVTGSPTGNNFFQVEGPAGSNLGGPGVNTVRKDTFSLSGKLYASNITVDKLTSPIDIPVITGTVSDPTATVTVTVNGTTYNATNNGDGTWQATVITPLPNGTYDVQATATPVTGNPGNDLTTNELTVNVAPPQPPVVPGTGTPANVPPVQTDQTLNIVNPRIVKRAKKSLTLTWSTNVPTSAVIKYGTKSTNLNMTKLEPNVSTEHTMTVGKLKRKKTHFFRITVQNADGSQKVESIVLRAKTK